ncbi:MAG: universal stress protein [Solirubrobacterales bacterium]
MFERIAVAVDGSEGSRRAAEVAAEIARRDGAELVLVHVDERMATKGRADVHPDEELIQEGIRRLAGDLDASGVPTSVRMATVMAGGAGHVVAEVAGEEGADLIVAGTRGHSSLAGLLVGSVTHRLLHVSAVPVLVVPSA